VIFGSGAVDYCLLLRHSIVIIFGVKMPGVDCLSALRILMLCNYVKTKVFIMYFLKVATPCYAILAVLLSCSSTHAEMLSTEWSIEKQVSAATNSSPLLVQQDTAALSNMLDNEELQLQLSHYGIDPVAAKARIAALTPSERQLLQNHIDSQPVGGSFIGIATVLFMFFIVTDMLCATDLFTFVNCINK
jgi:hypothetical protein